MLMSTPSRLSRGEELYRGDVTDHVLQKWGHMPGLLPTPPPPRQLNPQSVLVPTQPLTWRVFYPLPTCHHPPLSLASLTSLLATSLVLRFPHFLQEGLQLPTIRVHPHPQLPLSLVISPCHARASHLPPPWDSDLLQSPAGPHASLSTEEGLTIQRGC